MAVGNASSFAPDAAKAEASAKEIFRLLDRVPAIDSESTDGDTLSQVKKRVVKSTVVGSFINFFCKYINKKLYFIIKKNVTKHRNIL